MSGVPVILCGWCHAAHCHVVPDRKKVIGRDLLDGAGDAEVACRRAEELTFQAQHAGDVRIPHRWVGQHIASESGHGSFPTVMRMFMSVLIMVRCMSETDRSQAVDIRRSGRRVTGTNVYVTLCQALGRAIRPTPSTGSATDAVAQVCGLRRVDHPNDLQLHARRQHLELPTATPEQHRDLMYY